MSKKSRKSPYDKFYCVFFEHGEKEFLLNFFVEKEQAVNYACGFASLGVRGTLNVCVVPAEEFYEKYVYKGGEKNA